MARFKISAISIACWANEYLLYHYLSGDTHLVSGEFSFLFENCINRESITLVEIVNLSQLLGLDKPESAMFANRFIEQLINLNILETVESESK